MKNNGLKKNFLIKVESTSGHCPAGERIGKQMMDEGNIPVISCEGACIRGEIARLAANYLSKENGFGRGCHGELITVPDSQIAEWIRSSEKVICIDGCFLRCHSRILENLLESSQVLVYDALSHYKKYNDLFSIDDVPEDERKEVGRDVADWVLQSIKENKTPLNTASCSG